MDAYKANAMFETYLLRNEMDIIFFNHCLPTAND